MRLGSRVNFVIVSTSRRRKRRLGRCAARKRRIEERWPSGLNSTTCLQRRGWGLVAVSCDSLPLPSEEGGFCGSHIFERRGAGSTGKRAKDAQDWAEASCAVRIGPSLDVLARRKRSCRSQQAASDSEKRVPCLSPERTACGDEGLACQCERTRKRHAAVAGKGMSGTGSLRKASRDRNEIGDGPRRSAGALRMEGTLGS